MTVRIPRDPARIGAVERLVAERKVGDDVALDRRFQQRPLEPGGIAQMAAFDPCRRAAAARPECRRGIPRPCAMPSRRALGGVSIARRRAAGKPVQDLVDQRQTLLDLAHPDPDPRIDVAFVQDRHLEMQDRHRADRRGPARVEGAPRGAADKAAGGELLGQRRRAACRYRRCGPAARRCCRRARPGAGKRSADVVASSARRWHASAVVEVDGHAAGHDAVPHQAMAEARYRPRAARFRAARWNGRASGANAASLQMAPMSPRWLASRSSSAIERPQPDRAIGRVELERRLGGPRKSEGIGDRAVARARGRRACTARSRSAPAISPSTPLWA